MITNDTAEPDRVECFLRVHLQHSYDERACLGFIPAHPVRKVPREHGQWFDMRLFILDANDGNMINESTWHYVLWHRREPSTILLVFKHIKIEMGRHPLNNNTLPSVFSSMSHHMYCTRLDGELLAQITVLFCVFLGRGGGGGGVGGRKG